MSAKLKTFIVFLLVMIIAFVLYSVTKEKAFPLLDPAGIIALKERNLMILATLLMLIVVIPVFLLTAFFAWRYRATNTKAKYSPSWEHGRLAEFIWWAVPFVIVVILGVITWRTTHELDPFRPLESDTKPLTVQVVALNWKWLFIYPEEGIATVNYLQIPKDRPIDLEITADAPMNSFWIPALAGQIYAMTGMVTQLHLISHTVGSYTGQSANFSGEGFSGMKFVTRVTNEQDFDSWIAHVKASRAILDNEEYVELSKQSMNAPASYYASVPPNLYNAIVMKYGDSMGGNMRNVMSADPGTTTSSQAMPYVGGMDMNMNTQTITPL